MKKYIANILTGCRILGSVLLLSFPVFSRGFYITYFFCGFSDMIDGTIARKTNSVSQFGSKLDTVADLLFVIVSFIKILPTIHLPLWLWIWCGAIAVVKLSSFLWGCIFQKQCISLHTAMNKITGLLLFLFPLTLPFLKVQYSAPLICGIATVAAIQEGIYINSDKDNRRVE